MKTLFALSSQCDRLNEEGSFGFLVRNTKIWGDVYFGIFPWLFLADLKNWSGMLDNLHLILLHNWF